MYAELGTYFVLINLTNTKDTLWRERKSNKLQKRGESCMVASSSQSPQKWELQDEVT